MSDACSVEITCRRRDARRFERLGFKLLDDDNLEGQVLGKLGFGKQGVAAQRTVPGSEVPEKAGNESVDGQKRGERGLE